MPRRRRIKLAYLLCSLVLLAASLHAPTAYSAPGDPPSGSPAGAVYQLPLEQGRSDAAPKGGGDTSGGPGGGSAPAAAGSSGEDGGDSLYRSENNFGSSSQVPGVAAAGEAADGDGGAADGGQGAGGAAIAGGAVAAQSGDNGNTSVTAGIILIAAIALLAAAAGVASRRFSRRPS